MPRLMPRGSRGSEGTPSSVQIPTQQVAPSDGAKAVEPLVRRSYDVMLLDLSMPHMTGEDVLRWLRRQDWDEAGWAGSRHPARA